ncbi:MAG: hypothetical protein NTZ38_01135 [Candidatus Taylorbacteria bacterium]|nr:hypothetical protein [Candidatus Taylorbacteria bacterium]
MRTLTDTWDTRYRWHDPQGGKLGQMPWIEIERGEPIPPLQRARTLYVDSWYRNQINESILAIYWAVSDTEILLRFYGRPDDPRLKAQYEDCPAFKEKVIELLTMPEQQGKPDSQYRNHCTETTVSKDEIPEMLKPFVTSVETWKTFFQQPAISQLRGHHYTRVNLEGYLIAPIMAYCLRLGRPQNPDWGDTGEGFDFDPKTNPPTVADDGVYWELPEPKIFVTLPHEVSNARVAKYYGYLEKWQEFMREKKAFEKRMTIAHNRNIKEDEARLIQQKTALQQALLS